MDYKDILSTYISNLASHRFYPFDLVYGTNFYQCCLRDNYGFVCSQDCKNASKIDKELIVDLIKKSDDATLYMLANMYSISYSRTYVDCYYGEEDTDEDQVKKYHPIPLAVAKYLKLKLKYPFNKIEKNL